MALNFDKMSKDRTKQLFEELNEYGKASDADLIRLGMFDWKTNKMEMQYLTCINHRYVRYLTKDPYTRGLHFIQGSHGFPASFEDECECPFVDLRVVKETQEKEALPD